MAERIAGGLLWRSGMILLGYRSPQRRSFPACWDVLGGHLEPGESAEAALVRELQEEARITPIAWRHLTRIAIPGSAAIGEALLDLFIVEGWLGGAPRMQGDEHTAFRWFPPSEAARLPDLALDAYRPLFRDLR